MPSVFPVDSGSDKESKNASCESPPGILERGLHPSRVIVCAKRESVPLAFPLFGVGFFFWAFWGVSGRPVLAVQVMRSFAWAVACQCIDQPAGRGAPVI